MTVDPNEQIFIEAELVRSTEKAILVSHKLEEFWLPKSRIAYDEEKQVGDMLEIGLPIWLARDKGVI